MTSAENGRARLLLPALLLLGLLLRVPGMLSDFWLDEIWAWRLATSLSSPAAIFDAYHSANHHLYTLFLYLLGDAGWALHRVPSLLASMGSLLLVWRIMLPHGHAASLASLGLFATSHLMVHYASEARGYALCMFFSLALVFAAQRYLMRSNVRWLVVAWASVCLGLASHLLFVHALAGIGSLCAMRLWEQRRSPRIAVRQAFLILAPSALIVVATYLFVLRHYTLGKGDEPETGRVLIETLARLGGGSPYHPWALPYALAVAVAVLVVGWRLYRIDRGLFAMACGAGVLSPLAMLTFNSTQWLLPRYFMVSITFLLLAAGRVIGDAFGRPGYGRAVAGMVLGAYVVGHTMLLADQFRFGRGGYTQVIATILRGPSPGPVSISGGHTLRTRMVLAYYLGLWQQAWKARYVPVEQLTPDGVDWLILQTQEQPLRPAKRATDQHGNHYQLRQVEPTGGLSGFHWMLYQRMPSDPRRPKQPD